MSQLLAVAQSCGALPERYSGADWQVVAHQQTIATKHINKAELSLALKDSCAANLKLKMTEITEKGHPTVSSYVM